VIENEEIQNLAFDFEAEIHKSHPEVDHYYRKRIADVCANIAYMKDLKDLSELIAVKKALSYGKLL
jgi:hypothetical protein